MALLTAKQIVFEALGCGAHQPHIRTRKLSSPQQGWRIYSFLLFQEKKKDKSKVILGWFWTEILYGRTVYSVYYLTNTIGNPADQLCVEGGERERKPP